MQVLDNIDNEWIDLLKPNLQNIIDQLADVPADQLCPPSHQIFEFARHTTIKNIKVIILAQDPYPTRGDAHGLAFSSMKRIPPSLVNIHKCLTKSNLISQGDQKQSGNLTSWAKQGVLLLNTALTTIVVKPNAHTKLWNTYVFDLIVNMCNILEIPPILLLWGNNAKTCESYIIQHLETSKWPFIMTWCHPSPLAQGRLPDEAKFVNCPHFIDVNKMLVQRNQTPIDWSTS